MHVGRLSVPLAALAFAVFTLQAPAPAQAQNGRVFGQGAPFTADELPPGRLRSKIETLPAPARQRALDWLQSFSFAEADLDFLEVDREGGVFYSDSFLPQDPEESAGGESETQLPSAITAAEAFALHSNPGAPNVVFIDFDGHTISGTAWNNYVGTPTLVARPFDTDGNPGAFSAVELAEIAEVWHRVAEDLAPFDIDVTTEEPAVFGPTTGRILVTEDVDENGNAMPSQGAGGVAYVNVWGRSNYHSYYSPALVYFDNLGSGFPPYVAEASSHELGHNLALSHDGWPSSSYYGGHGSGWVSWAPIMGVGYYNNVTQWSHGEYADATNTEDDLAIIDGFLSTRFDDHGDGLAGATGLVVESNGDVLATNPETDPDNLFPDNKGVIEQEGDVDVFSLDVGAGLVELTVTPAWAAYERTSRRGANLDVEATLYDSGGSPLAVSDPLDETDAVLSHSVAAGRYYLAVTGVGNSVSPYSAYASLGQYFISGSVPTAALDVTPPNPDPMSFAAPPAASGRGSIDMTASGATDESGFVEYRFDCVAGGQGCAASPWQPGTGYTASGLDAGASYSFQVRARDGGGNETAPSSISSATTDANADPTAGDDGAAVAEDGSVVIDVLANDGDPDGDALTVVSVTQGANGSVTNNGGSVTYIPDTDFNGGDGFSYTAGDGFGGSATANVVVTVTPVNEDPSAAGDSASVPSGSSVTIDVLANDSDPDGDPLSVVSVTQGAKGSVTFSAGDVTYTANGKRGGDSFSYTAADGNGGTASATVSISIGKAGGGGDDDGGGGNGGGGNGGCHPKKGC